MNKMKLCASLLFLILLLPMVVSAEASEEQKLTEKGEIIYSDTILEMHDKNDEIKKIIDNTFASLSSDAEFILDNVIKTFKTYPEYQNITTDDLSYDLNNYYITSTLTVEQLNTAENQINNKYYHDIVIPIYLGDKNVYDFIIYYDLYTDQHKYKLTGHSSYRVYSRNLKPENTSILDISLPNEDFEKLVKNEIGEDTEIINQYLLLGEPDPGNSGIQEDCIYIRTNKGAYVFVSLSCSFALTGRTDIKNNSFYTVEEYFTTVKPELKSMNTGNTIDLVTTLFGIKGGYIIIPSAAVLLIAGTVFTLMFHKRKRFKLMRKHENPAC